MTTYNDAAVSNQDLTEFQTWEFNLGTTYWRYTNADRDVTFDSNVYTAIAVGDDGFKQTGDSQDTDDYNVTMPADLPVPQLFRGTPPSEEVWCTVRAHNYGDEMDGAVYFLGTVLATSVNDAATVKVNIRSLSPTLHRGGLRLLWGKQCQVMLYGPECRLNKDDWATPATISALDGITITSVDIASKALGFFDGGFVEWDRDDGSKDRRMIMAESTADRVTVMTSTDGLSVGDSVLLYKGCPHTWDGCASFDNTLNFGGCRHMIEKNPFDGNPIY